jgi:hypothetical protein
MTKRSTRSPRFTVTTIELFERPVAFRLPFRFGTATVTEVPQAFLRATIRATDGRDAQGMAAELMMPKWFDKSPARSTSENIDDLRTALALAAAAYCSNSAPRTAFGHAVFHYSALLDHGARLGLNPLTVSYGAALADRAILDALCRLRDVSIGTALWLNLPGLAADLTPDLAHFDFEGFLATLQAPTTIDARHTVGLADPLTDDDVDAARSPDDGLPVSLAAVIARYRNRWFKVKLSGDVAADVARLCRVAPVLEQVGAYRVTLDGGEQFPDAATLSAFFGALRREKRLRRVVDALCYIEQPFPRALTLETSVRPLSASLPLIIDGSDATLDAMPRAHALGYAGASIRNCKGVYKSLLNAARCARWNAAQDGSHAFVTGEDLTAQPGLALQQDLAIAALLGLTHVERNGHHYAAGFAGQHASVREQLRFLAGHPDVYAADGDHVRVAIQDGRIGIASLAVRGFGSSAWPDVDSLTPMPPSFDLPAQVTE